MEERRESLERDLVVICRDQCCGKETRSEVVSKLQARLYYYYNLHTYNITAIDTEPTHDTHNGFENYHASSATSEMGS